MIFFRSLVLIATAFVTMAGEGRAQYIESVDVHIANVDVVVTDRDGRPVRGLTKDDFELFEEGRPQPITNFSAFEAEESPVRTAGAPKPAATAASERDESAPQQRKRLFILFVDIDDIDPLARSEFFKAIRTFLQSSVRDGDLVAILTWQRRLRIIVPPTSDHDRIDAVINVLAEQTRWSETAIMQRAAETAVAEAEADHEFERATGRPASLESRWDGAAETAFQEWVVREQRCTAIRRKADSIRNLITTIGRTEMQGILIFASDDMSLQPSRDCPTTPHLDLLADTANAYAITIHALHPPGSRTRIVTGPERGGFLPRAGDPPTMAVEQLRAFDEAGGLFFLAKRTGGITASGPMESARLLERLAGELETYYSIGYRVQPDRADRARTISVRTKNRDYRVRARKSVVPMSDARRARDRVTTALYLPPDNATHTPRFDVRIDSITSEARFRVVHVKLAIRSEDLIFFDTADGGSQASFSVFFAAGTELGDASKVVELDQDVEFPSGVMPDVIHYSFSARVRRETRRLSIAVHDNASGEASTQVLFIPSR